MSQICTFDVILFPGLCWSEMSHLSFSKTASVRRIEVNGQQSFRYSSLKICPILPKIVSDDLWLSWTELASHNFLTTSEKKKLWCSEWQRRPKIGSEAVISAKLWSIETKLGMLHQRHDLRVHAKVGNSATYGYWDSKMSHILLITIVDLLVIVITSKLTNFGVSRTNSIAPPPVQIFNIEIIITHKPLILGNKT